MSDDIHNPHDAFFSSSMNFPQVQQEFCMAFVPEFINQAMNPKTLEKVPINYVDKQLARSYSDVVLSAEFNGELGYIYLLFEHQSSPDKRIVRRVLQYMARLAEDHQNKYDTDTIPVIYPLVFYHGKTTPYPYPTDWASAFDDSHGLIPQIFSEPLRVVDLNTVAEEDLHGLKWVSTLSLLMKHIRDTDSHPTFMRLVQDMLGLLPNDVVLNYLNRAAEYYFSAGETIDAESLVEQIQTSLPAPVRENIMTIAEQLRIQGLKQGRQEGRQEGLVEGEMKGQAKTIINLGLKRYGVLTPAQIETIENATPEQHDIWLETVFTAETAVEWLGY